MLVQLVVVYCQTAILITGFKNNSQGSKYCGCKNQIRPNLSQSELPANNSPLYNYTAENILPLFIPTFSITIIIIFLLFLYIYFYFFIPTFFNV